MSGIETSPAESVGGGDVCGWNNTTSSRRVGRVSVKSSGDVGLSSPVRNWWPKAEPEENPGDPEMRLPVSGLCGGNTNSVLSNSGFLRLREPKPDDPPDTDPPRIENKTVGRHDRRSNAAFAPNQPPQLTATSDRTVSKQRVLFFLWHSNAWTEVDLASSAVAQMDHSLNQRIPAPHVPFSLPLEHVLFSRSPP